MSKLTVELAVFIDRPLLQRFQLQYGYYAEDELWDFAVTLIQHVRINSVQ